METLIKKTSPFDIEQYEAPNNILSNLGYKPFEERTINLIDRFNKSIDKRYSESLNSTVFRMSGVFGNYHTEPGGVFNAIYDGVYKLGDFSEYIGNIPEENQIEIHNKYLKLVNNAFIKFKFRLLILAPLNNFASENNIKAIDPIVFAAFDENEGQTSGQRWFLIPLTHWL